MHPILPGDESRSEVQRKYVFRTGSVAGTERICPSEEEQRRCAPMRWKLSPYRNAETLDSSKYSLGSLITLVLNVYEK